MYKNLQSMTRPKLEARGRRKGIVCRYTKWEEMVVQEEATDNANKSACASGRCEACRRLPQGKGGTTGHVNWARKSFLKIERKTWRMLQNTWECTLSQTHAPQSTAIPCPPSPEGRDGSLSRLSPSYTCEALKTNNDAAGSGTLRGCNLWLCLRVGV